MAIAGDIKGNIDELLDFIDLAFYDSHVAQVYLCSNDRYVLILLDIRYVEHPIQSMAYRYKLQHAIDILETAADVNPEPMHIYTIHDVLKPANVPNED